MMRLSTWQQKNLINQSLRIKMKTWWIVNWGGMNQDLTVQTKKKELGPVWFQDQLEVVEFSEYEKLKKENEVLRKAVKAISARKTIAVYSYSEEFMDGSNTAFAQAAEIADEALEQADKIRDGK